MSRFVGLSLMCLIFMSVQAHDHGQYSGSSWVFQSYQDGDGEGEFQSESQEFNETGTIKHDRVKGNIEDGIYRVISRENLKDSAEHRELSPFFPRHKRNLKREFERDSHRIGENSKWILLRDGVRKPVDDTKANLMGRSKVPFGKMLSNIFGSKERKCKTDRRFAPHPEKELVRIRQDIQRQLDELKKQNQIMMKRMQDFEKYFSESIPSNW